MEAPPPSAAPTAAIYPDSVDSSPSSRHTDSWDADPPPPPQKLRLMCSYGGHIVPRPHDKSLSYIGGDTRIIVIDRHSSLSDLHLRLSKTLLHHQSFSLKYQIPNEDLDSLISLSTDEDLENMVEEHDRVNCSGAGTKPGRIRLFLFPKSSSSSVEQILAETASSKSEDWFFNVLNGKASASDRGFSESSSVNCLIGLEDEQSVGKASAAAKEIEGSKISVANHDVHSLPDSPMLDTTSSYGSTSSSPSVANLPPIRVHVEEKVGIEEQFQQMSVGNVNLKKEEEHGGFVAAARAVVVGGEYVNRVFSDDERSDHGGGYRKAQQNQQIPQVQQKQTVAFDLASPDSVSSDGSLTNPNPLSRQRQAAIYQDSVMVMQSGNTRVVANQAELKSVDQNSSKIQMQQESGSYVLSGQYDQNQPQFHHQQQFVHSGNQYIPAGAIPIASYYQMYPPSQQQHHPHLDQQYPFYFVPARQTQAYSMPMQQASYSDFAPNTTSSRPQTPPTAIAPQATYSQALNAPSSKPEMAATAGVYRTAAGAAPQLVQVPSSQYQAQYVGFTHIHHPSQSVAPSAGNSTYTYEFADPAHTQMYYNNQPLQPQLAAQYQTMTSSPAVVLSDASAQLPVENMKQQVRTVQP